MNTGEYPVLTVIGGPDNGTTIFIEKPIITLGRHPVNDVVVNQVGVSRKHAEIVSTDAGYQLRDLGSTNGSIVNRRKIEKSGHLLRDGDEIRLGTQNVSFVFRYNAASTLKMTAGGSVDPQAEVMPQPEGVADLTKKDASPPDAETYEGNVSLKVQAEDEIHLMVNFVQALRQKSQFRLLRMVSHSQREVDSLLGLREPLPLKEVLAKMQGVSKVSVSTVQGQGQSGRQSVFNVHLGGKASRK